MRPETRPLVEPMVATDVLELLQKPPVVASASAVVKPTHAEGVPVIADIGLTVTIIVAEQPPFAYEIVAVPPATPVTVPSVPTVAMPALLLPHTPPPAASVNAKVDPAHTGALPVIGVGNAVTVTVAVAVQPVETMYVILLVPEATPLTTPEKVTVATLVLLLVHDTPPEVASVKNVVLPTHTMRVPLMAAGAAFTFIVLVEKQPVPTV